MKRCIVILLISCIPFYSSSQRSTLTGKVLDKNTHAPLQSVSITIYSHGEISGNITNEEGSFTLSNTRDIDSVKFSCIGYSNQVIAPSSFNDTAAFTVRMGIVFIMHFRFETGTPAVVRTQKRVPKRRQDDPKVPRLSTCRLQM